MASDTPSSYTRVIDLTSKAQKKKRRAEVGELPQPDPPLDELTIDDLPDDIEQAVRAAGWTSLMPVQQKAIPYMLAGRDIIVQSRTGSGKTGAFLLPLFQILNPKQKEQQVLILTPTRELARQVFEEFERMKIATPRTNDLDAVLIYGGVGYGPQIEALENGAQLVVGTPGRVLDLLNKKKFDASNIHALILDEADEMLSMGFYPDMMEIRDFLPEDRQSYMFSATMPAKVRTVARDFLDDPGFLSLSSERVSVEEMKYRYYLVPPMQKDSTLHRLIELEEPESSIIFCNTKREVSYVTQFLNNSGFEAEEMSGDLSQNAREEAIDRLRDGIDVTELSHVFIYDVPQDREYLIHRSGRTARAGKKGTTIILATNEDEFELLRMARRYDIEVEKHELPEDPIKVAEDALAARKRDTEADQEIIDTFVPLVSRLAQSRPELLAILVAELYEEVQAQKEEEDEEDDTPGR